MNVVERLKTSSEHIIEPDTNWRRSGRTYRLVLQGLAAASGGKKVVYLARTQGGRDYAARLALRCLPDNPDGVSVSRTKTKFPSNGVIEFLDITANDRFIVGKNWDLLLLDVGH